MNRIDWGLIGGGEKSQIGFTHRAGACLQRGFQFAAGALDARPEQARTFGKSLGLDPRRAYGSWQEMLDGEMAREDRCALITIATPNATHFEIAKAFLEAGFHVLCEKPLTMTAIEARQLVQIAHQTKRICAVNYGYSGYPMIRQMRDMVAAGVLGALRVVFAEFAGGFMADAADADNPRVRWRFDPKQAGMAAVTLDCGTHALHLASYVTGQNICSVSSDFASGIKGRALEDDNLSAFRLEDGVIGRLWTSGLAIGRTHGLTLQVFGEDGGLCWRQENPNQLYWTPLNRSTQILERGSAELSPSAERASNITIGHPEGFVAAVGNIYRDLYDVISAEKAGIAPDPLALSYPSVEAGCHSIEVVEAMVASAQANGSWVEVGVRQQANLRHAGE